MRINLGGCNPLSLMLCDLMLCARAAWIWNFFTRANRSRLLEGPERFISISEKILWRVGGRTPQTIGSRSFYCLCVDSPDTIKKTRCFLNKCATCVRSVLFSFIFWLSCAPLYCLMKMIRNCVCLLFSVFILWMFSLYASAMLLIQLLGVKSCFLLRVRG